VPAAWNLNQRSALKQAARIAGLETLAIINENSAAALYYSLERIDNTTHTVIFYNVGSYNLQVTLAEYLAVNATSGPKKQVESVKILADVSVPNQGGNAYDLALATYFGKQFDAQLSRKGKKSIFSNVKGFLKILKAS
jgi:hypoxia up-regulated 1